MLNQLTPQSYKGGQKQLAADLERRQANSRRTLETLAQPETAETGTTRLMAVEGHTYVAICQLWRGEMPEAQAHLVAAAKAAQYAVTRTLPEMTSLRALNHAVAVRNGAIAASLAGEADLAGTLFGLAEQLAGGLVPGREGPPDNLDLTLDGLGLYPLTRAYCLLRLGRLTGFSATVFTAPWPEADTAGPGWRQTDVQGLLTTAGVCFERARARRAGLFHSERGLLPVLESLAASLTRPGEPEPRAQARAALEQYFRASKDIGDFLTTYWLTLDLQAAYPDLFA